MNSRRNLNRMDLFLVRMWTTEVLDSGEGTGRARTEWRGMVQRVVNGEARQFDSWQSLVDTLLVMLSDAGGSPPGAGQTEAGTEQAKECKQRREA